MQQVSEPIREALEEHTSNEIFAHVEMEIELNGYSNYTLDFPDSIEESMFSKDSVMLPRRPHGGLPKLIAGAGKAISRDIDSLVYAKDKVWYRSPSKNSKYKYFRSRDTSSAEESSGTYPFGSPLQFTVTYNNPRFINFITIGFEYASALPSSAYIEIYAGDQWIEVGEFSPNALGLVEVFYDGSWNEGRQATEDFTTFEAIRVTVAGMDSPGAGLELIQISPRLLLDLSSRVIDTTITLTREAVELDSPVGVSSANSAAVELENTDGFFNNDKQGGVLSGLIDVNIKFVVESLVRNGTNEERIPQIVGYANGWDFQVDGRVSVQLSDFAKILQSQRLDNSFYQREDIRFVIADIVERAQVVDYEIRYAESDSFTRIPYVYFDKQMTVWQVLQSIAVAEQAVFYFDESGRFIWESRDYLWQKTSNDLVFSPSAKDNRLPNLISYSFSYQTVANAAKVVYTPTDLLKYGEELNTNFLWELDEDTVLSASPLLNNLDEGEGYIEISADDYEIFPDEGIVNVDAEFIRYSKQAPEGFSGEDPGNVLYITKRGEFGSTATQHFVEDNSNYWTFETYWPGPGYNQQFTGEDVFDPQGLVFEGAGPSGFSYFDDSNLVIESTRPDIRNYAQYVSKSESEDFDVYGTQIRFPISESENFEPIYDGDGIAGIVFNLKSDELYPYQGYYVEMVSSEYARSSASSQREIRILKIKNQLEDPELLAGFFDADLDLDIDEAREIFGAELIVFPDNDYKMEVLLEKNTIIVDDVERKSLKITVLVNGRRILSYTDIESDDNEVYTEGSWGVYARSNTEVEFEYVYAIDRRGDSTRLYNSQTAIRDRLNGGFVDNTLESFLTEFNSLRNDFFFDDFGSWVREVREFDVNHDIFPAVSTSLFISNDTDTYLIYYNRDQFSSKFAVGNRTRDSVFLSGDDPRAQNRMTTAVYGVPIEQKEQNEEERRDELSILRRGEFEVVVDSQWIQTKNQAARIADWITSRWSRPVEFVQIDAALDPRVQLGDLVSIDMPENDLTEENNQFHIVSIQRSIGSTHSFNATLRRVNF